jgi:hypothetical protein
MSPPSTYRRPPRGRPLIGFQLDVPREVELRDGPILHCREVRQGGQTLGEIELSVFAAALIIDRDGILAEKACEVLGREAALRGEPTAVAVRLPGACGFRADAVQRTPLPYRFVFAIAPDEVVDGGVLITIRCTGPDWPAAEHMLRSLRVLTRGGRVATEAEFDDGPLLPVVTPRRD